MTRLKSNVTRVVEVELSLGRVVELAVTLTPSGVVLREKGSRTSYTLPYKSAFNHAGALEANRQRAEKVTRRKVVRVSRGLLATEGR